jgi:pentatricopeptide repeat protein
MKQPRSICLACRFKLLAVQYGSTPRPAWQHSTRLSSTVVVPARPARDHDQAEPRDSLEHQLLTKSRPLEHELLPKSRPLKKSSPKWAGRHKDRALKDRGQASGAFDIFKTVVEGDSQDQDALSTSKSTSAAALQLFKDVATLEELLARPSTSTNECFQYFQNHIHPHISKARAQVPRVLRNRVGRVLMERVTRAKERDFDSRELPSVTNIGQTLLELNLFEPNAFASLITHLLAHICSISTEPREYTSIESYETAMARRDTLLYDLVGSWKVLNVSPHVLNRTGNAAKAVTEARLPQLSKKMMSTPHQGKSKAKLSIASLFPHYTPLSLRSSIPAAIATYVLLTDPINRTNRMFRAEIAVFVDAMTTVLLRNRPNRKSLPELFGPHATLQKYITERWSAVENQLEEQTKFQEVFGGGEDDQPSMANQINQMKRIHRQLGQANNTGNSRMLQRTWDEFWGLINAPSEKKEQVLRDNAELFNYFIRAYMGIRQPNRAIEIWNCMVSAGLQPTIKTWNSMIDGCKGAKNLVGLKNVWEKLVASGMKLDTAIWTTRISGLIELGDPKAGLLALEEMAKIWKQSQMADPTKPNPVAVKPTIEPVNAALAGLLRLDRASAANGLLTWAAKQGIEPDIYTFNTLLGPLVRKGLDSEVQAIFKMMKNQNVEANVATFTILLEGALDGIGEQTPAEQVQTIKNFLRAMRDADVTANMQLYAKIIHLLLQEGDRTGDAVNEVLAIIWGQELELTSHIYTMLADHYFTRDPPAPWAVTALIENRQLHENRDIDRVFWERVISGYCQVGDTARALQSFEKIDRSGGKITFSTLYDLLLVLSRSGETEAIHKVIEVAKKNIDQHPPGEQGGDAKSRFWKHRFWHLADRYGFLQDDLRAQFEYGNQ